MYLLQNLIGITLSHHNTESFNPQLSSGNTNQIAFIKTQDLCSQSQHVLHNVEVTSYNMQTILVDK
jgi:hypothetical protein